MKLVRFGELDAYVTGGADREGGGSGPVVVLMHGFGAPGTDLVGLWRVLQVPPETRFVFPVAPLAMPELGFGEPRAWWMIDMARLERALATGNPRDMSEEVPDGLPDARSKLIGLLEAVERDMAPGRGLVLGGFSQGAMLALDVALHTPRPLAGLVLMSTTLLAQDEWIPRMAARKGTRVIQSHGRLDALLPFSQAERLRDLLREAGLDVAWVPFGGGHEIPPTVLTEVGRFLGSVLA